MRSTSAPLGREVLESPAAPSEPGSIAQPAFPCDLARYIATSARRTRSPGSAVSAGASAMPMLVEIWASPASRMNGSCDERADAVGDLDRRGRVVDAGQHDRELVAAHAGDDVAGTHAAAQAAATVDEELVADVVTEVVVDVLEAVEVEEEHPDRVFGPAAPAQRAPALRGSGAGSADSVSASCDASCASRSFSVCSSRYTCALRSEAPACAANSSRLSVCDAGGSPGRASARSARSCRSRLGQRHREQSRVPEPSERAEASDCPTRRRVCSSSGGHMIEAPAWRARSAAASSCVVRAGRRGDRGTARTGRATQPSGRFADQLEHLRLGESHFGDGVAQHVEDLVDVEARALAAAERGGTQQAPAVLGLVAAAAVRRDLGDEVLGEEAARERDEQHDREPLRDGRDRQVVRAAPVSSRRSRRRARSSSRSRRRIWNWIAPSITGSTRTAQSAAFGVAVVRARDEQHDERVGDRAATTASVVRVRADSAERSERDHVDAEERDHERADRPHGHHVRRQQPRRRRGPR